jgi:sulfur carrier protein ThiS
MKVEVVLFAHLADFQPDGKGGRHSRTFDLAEGTTIADVIAMLGLPDEPRVIFVNNRHAEEAAVLHDGDRLAIFPPVAGG